MSELTPVFEQLVSEVEAGRPAALCAVVATKGSAPQRPGAAMLLRHDCSTAGTLGGGCVEQEVKRRAYQSVTTGRSALLEFVLNHDYGWDDGLICGGKMSVAVAPFLTAESLAPVRAALADLVARRPAILPLRVRAGETKSESESEPETESAGEVEYRLQLDPAPTLLIAGAGHVGTALARLAVELDFKVVVFDDRADYANAERFPAGVEVVVQDIAAGLARWPIDADTYVVIVTRGHQHDHQALEAVIRSDAGYLGLIGSRRKTRMIYDDLLATGVPSGLIERVHSPIGLAIGAVTVPEIAVSIAAQLVEHRRRHAESGVAGPFPVPAAGSPVSPAEQHS